MLGDNEHFEISQMFAGDNTTTLICQSCSTGPITIKQFLKLYAGNKGNSEKKLIHAGTNDTQEISKMLAGDTENF